jgi:Zn-dependent protease with chaperone function
MLSIRAWLVPRVAFWVIWTGWLCCLQFLLKEWIAGLPARALIAAAPMLVITWIGSRGAKEPFDTSASLLWKGAAVSFLLGVFANVFVANPVDGSMIACAVAAAACIYMWVRGMKVRRIELRQGDLFDAIQAIARRMGVTIGRVIVYTSPKNTPAAFAHRQGAVVFSDGLLRLLSRHEIDAVAAHEAAHLRPFQKMMLVPFSFLAGALLFVSVLWPAVLVTAPLWPLGVLLLWRAIRRRMEFDADANAIRASSAELLITALTRVHKASGLPMHWNRAASLFMSHPPMTARFRAIARRAGLSASRVDELVSTANSVPALPGYGSPFDTAPPADASAMAAHRDRLGKQMVVLSWGFPIAAGISATLIARFWSSDFGLTAAWTVFAILLYYVLYEVVVGSERRRVRDRIPDQRPGGYFVGIGTAAEPRYYDNAYHYDLGMVSVDGGTLDYKGARCAFSVSASQVRRVWAVQGPPHWTPRIAVCVEYENDAGNPAVLSMQSFDRWFWPATSQASRKLLEAVRRWSESAAADGSTVAPPQVNGVVIPPFRLRRAAKWIEISCGVSLCGSWMIFSSSPDMNALIEPYLAPLVTLALVLFVLAPQMRRSGARQAESRRSSMKAAR